MTSSSPRNPNESSKQPMDSETRQGTGNTRFSPGKKHYGHKEWHKEYRGHNPLLEKKTTPGQWALFLVIVLVTSLVASLVYSYTVTGSISPSSTFSALLGKNRKAGNTPVTVGVSSVPENLNLASSSDDAVSQALLGNVYQPLLQRKKTTNSVEASSDLVNSWTVDKAGLIYTFEIKKRVYFSNGQEMTVNDIIRCLQTGVKNNYPGYSSLKNARSVTSSAGAASTKLIITLSSPQPDLPWLLAGRMGIVYGQETSQASGTGPFTIGNFKKGSSLDLEARRDHQYQRSNLSKVTLRAYPSQDKGFQAVHTGDIDAYVPSGPVSIATIAETKKNGTAVDTADTGTRVALAFNESADSIFSEQHAREAYRDIINRNALISALGYQASALAGPIPSVDPGYQDLNKFYPQNIPSAKNKLWYFGFTSSTLVYPQSMGPRIGEILKKQCALAGQSVTVLMLNDKDYHQRVEKDKNFDMALVRYTGSHDLGTLVDPDYFISYTDSITDENWAATSSASSDAAYIKGLTKTAARLAQKAAFAWLYQEKSAIARKPSLSAISTTSPQSYLPLWSGLQTID